MRYAFDSRAREKLTARFGDATTESLQRIVRLSREACEMDAASNLEIRREIQQLIEELLRKLEGDFFSRCWGNYHGIVKPLNRFLHTIAESCENQQSPKRGTKPDTLLNTLALNIGRCLAETGIDLKDYGDEKGDFAFAIYTVFKALDRTVAVPSTRPYIRRAIAHLKWKEDFMSRVPAIQRDRFNSIRDRLPKTRRGQKTRKVERQIRAKILSRQ